ncbi:hypothetical protein MHA_1723 [Mannheimia haemolytica PHL213]|nr:hypothetical protein MHA_1723 [Mannheimia haemolytica PHL213]
MKQCAFCLVNFHENLTACKIRKPQRDCGFCINRANFKLTERLI